MDKIWSATVNVATDTGSTQVLLKKDRLAAILTAFRRGAGQTGVDTKRATEGRLDRLSRSRTMRNAAGMPGSW